jgi:hypothetical protein
VAQVQPPTGSGIRCAGRPGVLHAAARVDRPVVHPPAALPPGLHAEQRRRAAVGVDRAVRGGGARPPGARRAPQPHPRCCTWPRCVRSRPTTSGSRSRAAATAPPCTSPGSPTPRRCGRSWTPSKRRWRSPPARTGARCSARAAGAAAAVAPPALLRRAGALGRPGRPIPQRVSRPSPARLMPCQLGPMLWPSSQMG